jgi:hypothetical protein
MNDDYRQGFIDGYETAKGAFSFPRDFGKGAIIDEDFGVIPKRKKRKVKQSPKQKLLTKMTKKKWDKYKKGRGKKTYVEIRGEVSRSQAYKKAVKRL